MWLKAQLSSLSTSQCTQHWGNKQEELETVVQLENCDLIAIVESWWDDSHNWNTMIDGYELFRKIGRASCRERV